MQFADGHEVFCAHVAYLDSLELGTCCHKANGIADLYMTVFDTAVYDNAFVLVIVAVKYQRFERCIVIALRAWNIRHDAFEHLFDVRAHFCGDARRIHCRYADDVLDLVTGSFGVCAGQIYLIDNRNDFKVIFYRKVGIGKRLCLDALRCVNDKYSTLTGNERT